MFAKKSISKKFFMLLTVIFLLFTGVLPAQAQSASSPLHIIGTIWHVATTGNDANDCITTITPCATINGAIGKAVDGDTIEVAIGTYTGTGTEVVLINKSITLSGGWDATFTTQSGMSTIDGGGIRRGITTTGNPVIVDRFTIQNGFNDLQGGGIRNSGSLTLSDSIVSGNVSHWMGGGIFNFSTMIINNTTINGNTGGKSGTSGGGGGGGIQNYDGTLTLNNSTVSNNKLIGSYSGSGIDSFGTVTLNNSTVSGNTGYGAISGSTVVLNNSTVSNNQPFGLWGGQVTLQNTIVAGNGIGDCMDAYSTTIISQGYNLIGNNTGCIFTPAIGDKIGTSAKPLDPLLGPLQDNGGATFTHALLFGSPALNAGNPAMPGSEGSACLMTDQRGMARPVDSACDIGAFEGYIPVPFPLSPTGDSSDSTPTYKWIKIPGATKYQFQLIKGTKTIYTKIVSSSVCKTTTCSNTPTNILVSATYKWRVRAMLGGVWQAYSAYKPFAIIIPNAGFWNNLDKTLEFYVTPNQSSVANFAFYFGAGCGNYKVIHSSLIPIVNKKFAFSGTFHANGAFISSKSATGTWGLRSFYVPGCGYASGGPFLWATTWKNSGQTDVIMSGAEENSLITVVPEIEAPFNIFVIRPDNQ